jgi:soluble lytic murein transglycosylase-like protein
MARKGTLFSVAGAVCALACATAGSAAAQVLEIGDDGAVVTHAGPAVYTDAGARLIAPPAEPARYAPAEVAAAIQESAQRHSVPTPVVEAVAWQESRYNQAAVSPKGAVGVMQLLPSTASDLGVNPQDLKSNIDGGAAYIAQMIRRFGNLKLALAAYNAGPEAVARDGDVPPYAETQSYVRAILARLAAASVVPGARAE